MRTSNPEVSKDGLAVAVVGATGFVGRAVVKAVVAAGHRVIPMTAVRLKSNSTSVQELLVEASAFNLELVHKIALAGRAADVAINAAGLATPGAPESAELMGANALLPAVLARVALAAGWSRLVHLSSAAVYGVGLLAEDLEPRPTSPYARSKLLGDLALVGMCDSTPVEPVVLRPTSVHGPDRAITRTLTRFARSPLASVAGVGDWPTPQVSAANVAAAATYLATCIEPPEWPVLQPWEGVTSGSLLRSLGHHEPHHVPLPLAKVLLMTAGLVGHLSPRLGVETRRLEMLWFGQLQAPGWFDAMGWTPPYPWTGRFN